MPHAEGGARDDEGSPRRVMGLGATACRLVGAARKQYPVARVDGPASVRGEPARSGFQGLGRRPDDIARDRGAASAMNPVTAAGTPGGGAREGATVPATAVLADEAGPDGPDVALARLGVLGPRARLVPGGRDEVAEPSHRPRRALGGVQCGGRWCP